MSEFAELDRAYDWLNARLFGGSLPRCVLRSSLDDDEAAGVHHPGPPHEIALDCRGLIGRGHNLVWIMSVLVHEMAHVWQHEFGTSPAIGYHNEEFRDKMEALGLITSHTGEVGGARTGRDMCHRIAEDGPFLATLRTMPIGLILPWVAVEDHGAREPC